MSLVCIHHKKELTSNEAYLGMCSYCLEELALQSAANMGTPDYYLCGYCGYRCNQEKLVEHITKKRCTIGLVQT